MRHQRILYAGHYASLILLLSAFLISAQAQTIDLLLQTITRIPELPTRRHWPWAMSTMTADPT